MWSDLLYRLRALFRRRAVESEMEEELRFHSEQHVGKSLQAGLSADEAARRLRLEFGGTAQIEEQCRDARGVAALENLWRDLVYAARVLSKSKGFAAVVVLILALGIGANTAAFSFVDAILLKKLPVERPDELVLLRYLIDGDGPLDRFGYPYFREIERQNQVFEGMLGSYAPPFHFTTGGAASIVHGEIVTGGYFRTLGVHAVAGRTLTDQDDGVEGAHPVCVISWQFWQDRFGGDPAVVGHTVLLDAHPYIVVGVLQPGFRGAELQARRDIFVPASMVEQFAGMKRDQGGWGWMEVMARLKPGVSIAQAKASVSVLVRRLSPKWTAVVEPGAQGFGSARKDLGTPALISLGAVGLVLLIACANVAGLLLARALKRYRELAVRLSLGATRARLVRQLLMECVLLAVAGAVASIAVAAGLLELLLHFLQKPGSDAALLVGLDGRVLAFTVGLAALALAAFGVLPAWYAARLDVSAGLRDQPFGLARSTGRLRQSLIVVQVALGIVLLFGAGVLARSLRHLDTIDLGFNPERVVAMNIEPGKSGYSDAGQSDLYARFLDSARRLPAVESASLSLVGVLSGQIFAGPVRVPGHTRQKDEPNNNYNVVSTDYFRTLGIPLIAGRDFTDEDRAGAPAVVIVNQRFVEYYWPHQNVVGRHIRCLNGRDAEIVGVVKTARYQKVREDPQIIIYMPLKQQTPSFGPLTLHARTRAHPELVLAQLRGIVRGLDPKLPVIASALLEQRDATISRERLLAFLSSFLALLAAALVAVGLYGLIVHSVAARTREIGVRLALGARPAAITWMFVRQALVMVALGIVLGLPIALACSRFLKSIVFGITPQDPLAIISGCALLAAIAAAAATWAAVNGARQDPLKALRCE